jgi:hypothetical protein
VFACVILRFAAVGCRSYEQGSLELVETTRSPIRNELTESFDAVLEGVEARASAHAAELRDASPARAAEIFHVFDLEVGAQMALARSIGRADLAAQLQAAGQRGMALIAQSRVAAVTEQIAEADTLYDQGEFESARAKFYGLRNSLNEIAGRDDLPPSLKIWAAQTRPTVDERLAKAVRGKRSPETIQYFDQWRSKKADLNKRIENLSSQAERSKLGAELATSLAFVERLSEMTPSENKLVPAKYRSPEFQASIRSEVEAFMAKADKRLAYVVSCGDKPRHSPWDGGNVEAERLVEGSAHDPDSIDSKNCSVPKRMESECWEFKCDVRGRNLLGVLVFERKTFHQNATTISAR